MRISLRTLLAFEDNVFDAEHRRHLEQQIMADGDAAAVLDRIRNSIRNASIGVPGLVDQQEEIDPNYVAEYLDHQMSEDVQNRFETFCLSADKYIAEIASVHQILSNVLGEPARTSRECRSRCYDVLRKPLPPLSPTAAMRPQVSAAPSRFVVEEPANFGSQLPHSASDSSIPPKQYRLWNWLAPLAAKLRLAVSRGSGAAEHSGNSGASPHPSAAAFYKFGFFVLGMFFCYWLTNSIPKADFRPPFVESAKNIAAHVPEHDRKDLPAVPSAIPKSMKEQSDSIRQTNFMVKVQAEENSSQPLPKEKDPFLAESAEERLEFSESEENGELEQSAAVEPAATESATADAVPPRPETVKKMGKEHIPAEVSASVEEPARSGQRTQSTRPSQNDAMITFHRISSQTKDLEMDGLPEYTPINNRTTPHALRNDNAADLRKTGLPAMGQEGITSMPPKKPASHPVALMSAAIPRTLGHIIPAAAGDLLFSAPGIEDPWSLVPAPSDLTGGQYLLSAEPFRSSLELTAGFRIEMIGDAKVRILPLDAVGVPGIFVDYGRIVIQSQRPNAALRIEMDNVSGTMRVSGTSGTVFLDTFAEVFEPYAAQEGDKPKIRPILGFVPKGEDTFSWKIAGQPQTFTTNKRGSLVLSAAQYRFGEIKNVPNWIGPSPLPLKNQPLAETCRRYFAENQGNSGKALSLMVRDDSEHVRALAYRLLGDLGDFDFAVRVMAEKRAGDEGIRRMLVPYFNEVMKRDAYTVQRFADALAAVKQAKAK